MTDELDDVTDAEREEAEAFARALTGELEPGAPSDAIEVAGVLRAVSTAPTLDARLEGVRGRVLGAPAAPTGPSAPRNLATRRWTWAGAVVALSSAAAVLLFVPMSASPPVSQAPTSAATAPTTAAPTIAPSDTPSDGTATPVTTPTSGETQAAVAPTPEAPAADERAVRDAAELSAVVRGLLRSETPPLDAVVEVAGRMRDARFGAMLAAHRGAP